jgi:hypothetical protein
MNNELRPKFDAETVCYALLSRPWCCPSIDMENDPAKVTFLFPIRLKLFDYPRPLLKSL